ncbi:MAG: hypothetical protein JWQ63_1822 [Mucilaginibacter sp.]|nr:hypothetical protein [Mucilaginibacter sp.]
MKLNTFTIAGISLTLLGIGMFCFGVSIFVYQGKPLSNFINEAGKYSFMLWLPMLIIGIAFLCIRKNPEK